ncbi:MAG: UbiA family prenyltransferase [Egibacteraceae bacterium]
MTALLRATHLEATVAVTLIAFALALAVGRGAGSLLVAAAVLAGQCSIGWSNDWLDAARDRANGRRDKPTVVGLVRTDKLRNLAFTALAACVVLSLANGLLAGLLHLVAVGLGWAYNLVLKRTPASVLAYAGAFGLLPVFIVLSLGEAQRPTWWFVTAAALLGAGAHFANALPDLADDRAQGIDGLPQRLGARGSAIGSASLLALGVAVAVAGGGVNALGLAVLIAALLLAGLVAGRSAGDDHRGAFKLSLAIALLAVTAMVISGSSLVS